MTLGDNPPRQPESVQAKTNDETDFVVKDWTVNNESFPEAIDYKWRMEFNPLANENGSYYGSETA